MSYLQPINLFLFTVFSIHLMAMTGFLSSLVSVGILGLLVVFLITAVRQKKIPLQKTGYELLFLVLILATLLAIPDAYSPSQAWAALANNLGIVILYYLLSCFIKTKEHFYSTLQILFVGFVLILIAGMYQYLAFKGSLPLLPVIGDLVTQARGLHRISSVFIRLSGANAFAAYLALSIPIFFSWLRYQKITWWHLLLVMIILFNFIFSLSRTLIVSLLFVGIVFILFSSKNKNTWKFLFAGITFFILLLVFVGTFRNRVFSIFDANNGSNKDHWQSILVSIDAYTKHPLNGWGGAHINKKFQKTANGWLVSDNYRIADGRVPAKKAFEQLPFLQDVYTSIYILDSSYSKPLLTPLFYVDTMENALSIIDNLNLPKEQKKQLKSFLKETHYERWLQPITLMAHDQEDWQKYRIRYLHSPHNIYLYYAIEYGLLGILAVLLLFGLPLQKLLKVIAQGNQYSQWAIILLPGWLGFATYGFFHDSLQCSIIAAFYLIFMLLCALLEKISGEGQDVF